MMNVRKLLKNKVVNIVLLLVIIGVLVVVLKQSIGSEQFASCCPPSGTDPIRTSECGPNDGSSSDCPSAGKLVLNGSARCKEEGIAFGC